MANSSRHATYYIAESTFGTTPTSPAFSYFRNTGNTLGMTKTEIASAELYSDRGIRDSRHGNKQGAGDTPFELSYNTYEDLLEAAFGSTFSTPASPVTATTISADSTGNTIDDSGSGFGSFVAGELVKVEGFDTADNNGVGMITAAAAGSITVDGIDLTSEAAAATVTISPMETLKIGVTRTSFSLIRDFADLTAGRYQLYPGSSINTLSLTTGLDAIITGSIGWIEKNETSSASAPASATFGNATTTEPFVSFDGCVRVSGVKTGIVTAFTVNLNNGLEAKFNVCSDTTAEPGIGQAEVTASMSSYFDNDTLLNAFLDETEITVTQNLVDAAGNTFAIFAPKVKVNSGQPDVGGEVNGTIDSELRLLYDSTAGSALLIGKLDA